MTRPTLRQRNQAIRNLRNGPVFLTPARVAGMIDWLSAVNAPRPARSAPVATTPVALMADTNAKAAKVKRPRKAKPLVAALATVCRSRVVFRFVRPSSTPPVPAPIVVKPVPAPVVVPQTIAPLAKPVIPAPRPTVRILGVQNGSSAIAWLRSHGVSVRAAHTSVFGTMYLASNELGEMDVAAIVALARRKGFEG